MNALLDAAWSDDRRRQALHDSHLFVVSPTPSAVALLTRARELVEASKVGRRSSTGRYASV
jgi:hypothetical protein